jgi:serine/threonine protein kinase, bacterial
VAEQPTVLNGAYRLLRPAGSGGTARVYLAENTETGEKVALKVLRRELADQPEFAKRFHREAALLAHAKHPHLVQLHRLADAPEGLILVLEWVEGERLDQVLSQGPFPVASSMMVLQQLAAALEALHGHGIVHRDLKPENMMLEDRAQGAFVRLLDLGIARFSDKRKAAMGFVTMQGKIAGTPTYLSPEQIMTKSPTPATDIYSYGVVAYQLLAGKAPFSGADFVIMQKHITDEPPRLEPMGDVPEPVIDLIHRCLEKSPGSRPSDGAALVAAWGEALAAAKPKRAWWKRR